MNTLAERSSAVAAPANIKAIQPIKLEYRNLPIDHGFDWHTIIEDIGNQRELPDDKLYLVVFRSLRNHDADDQEIARLDTAAHIEAGTPLLPGEVSPLLHYFADTPDAEQRAMSWCLWTQRTAARLALNGPAHREASQRATEFYDDFSIEAHDVILTKNQPVFNLLHSHTFSRPDLVLV